MAGLAQEPRAPQQDDQPSTAGMMKIDENDLQQASPEEQAQYDHFITGMMDVLYPGGESAGQVNPEFLSNLRGDFAPEALAMFEAVEPPVTNSPSDSLAATSVMLTLIVENMGKQQDGAYSDDVVMHGGQAAIEELAEIAEAAKIHDFDERELEGAFYRAIDIYRVSSPRADPQSLTDAFLELADANKGNGGNLVLPGLPGGPPAPQSPGAQPQPGPAQ